MTHPNRDKKWGESWEVYDDSEDAPEQYVVRGGESRNILHLYSDRTDKNISNDFFKLFSSNSVSFLCGKAQIAYRFL